jgi:hypothetical protein
MKPYACSLDAVFQRALSDHNVLIQLNSVGETQPFTSSIKTKHAKAKRQIYDETVKHFTQMSPKYHYPNQTLYQINNI